jgi:nitroreductase
VLSIPQVHRAILEEGLRAPSAHNAQPWRFAVGSAGYELHYDHHDYLPFDPDDRDAYLCLGALIETLALAAQRHGQRMEFALGLERQGSDLFVGTFSFRAARPDEPVDPLAGPAADRHTNRRQYRRDPLPAALEAELGALGCTLVAPGAMATMVARASIHAWRDRRFVRDLRTWFHDDPTAPTGMTAEGLLLSRIETVALHLAFRAGRLPAPLATLYASRDVRLLRRAASVAVLGADDPGPAAMIEAGRRLLRAWVAVCAAGYAYHPISIALDRPETAPDVAGVAGVAHPVAVFRLGRPRRGAPRSNRRTLESALLPEAKGPAEPVGTCPGAASAR